MHHQSTISRKPMTINNAALQALATVQTITGKQIFCSNVPTDKTSCFVTARRRLFTVVHNFRFRYQVNTGKLSVWAIPDVFCRLMARQLERSVTSVGRITVVELLSQTLLIERNEIRCSIHALHKVHFTEVRARVLIFTVQSAVLLSLVVCLSGSLSVTLVDHDHIG